MTNFKKFDVNKIMNILVVFVVSGIIFCFLLNITHATTANNEPDVEITINTDGNVSTSGNIFEDVLWYPGVKSKGVIRINNNFKNIRIDGIGIKITIGTSNSNHGQIEKSFYDNMRLTVKRGKFLIFNDLIIDDKSFTELMNSSTDGTFSKITFESDDRYKIMQSDSMDLQYELCMDVASGNELQNLSANTKYFLYFSEE